MKDLYLSLKLSLIDAGYADEMDGQTNVHPCEDALGFMEEAIWVILNSGMKEQIARMIWERIRFAMNENIDISKAFGHKGKVSAIKHLINNHDRLFSEYQQSEDKIAYLQTIPFIGGITKYHLAKNLGHDVVKPDRHLVRIADKYGYADCNSMCNQISSQTGDKVSVVDIVLWRSANLGII